MRITRRTVLLLAPLAAAKLALPRRASAQSIQRVHGGDRPALPKMGPSFRQEVPYGDAEPAGTIVFGWTGMARVGAKKEWPEWRPPAEMRAREPGLPDFVPAGPYNPMGARALYLHSKGRDTLYRIHGTNNPDGVGFDGTSGCFRLTNTDVIDLFARVDIGTRVIVE